ncbi:transposable element Tc1 transposase [Trichonephila clavipes]|nr:transposable element Tc1 transposase [Trichonephila clavipes]
MDTSGFGGCPANVALFTALGRRVRWCFSWIRNMNSEMDISSLPILWQYFGEGPFLFQQDDCSIHTSRLAQTGFDDVQKLDWPSRSPHLNPIEHLWDELEHRLRSQPNRPSSLQARTLAVMDDWKAIPMVTYQKWVESLPKRVQAVIHATNIILICASEHSEVNTIGCPDTFGQIVYDYQKYNKLH